jgi:hypothetical protein
LRIVHSTAFEQPDHLLQSKHPAGAAATRP